MKKKELFSVNFFTMIDSYTSIHYIRGVVVPKIMDTENQINGAY